MTLDVLGPVLPLELVRLDLAEDPRARLSRPSEVRVDVLDVHENNVDDVWSLLPLARRLAVLRVTPWTLVVGARHPASARSR
jgi:hypothetical protein